jgi:parvulin-like peptidyl-prolyl isomerase
MIATLLVLVGSLGLSEPPAPLSEPPAPVAENPAPQAEKPAPASETLLDGVVSVVNGELITLGELDQLVERAGGTGSLPADPVTLGARRREAMAQRVREILVLQQAREMSIEVTESEVDDHVSRVQKENNFTTAQLEENLRRVGFADLGAYREVVKREMLKSHVVSVKVRSRLKVSDGEVDEVMKREYGGGSDEAEIHCFHLMLRVDAFAPDVAHRAARDRLLEVKKEIESGAIAFPDAARKYSDDVTARDGGDLGWFTTGTLEESFEKVAFRLEPGKMSDVVQTPFGHHVVLVTEKRRKPVTAERKAALVSAVRERLYQEKYVTSMATWFEQLEKQAEIKKLIEL